MTKTREQVAAKFFELSQEARDAMKRYLKMFDDTSVPSDIFGSYADDTSLYAARAQTYREANYLVLLKPEGRAHPTRAQVVEWFHDRVLEGAAYAERSTSPANNQAKRDLLAARTQLYRDMVNGRFTWEE